MAPVFNVLSTHLFLLMVKVVSQIHVVHSKNLFQMAHVKIVILIPGHREMVSNVRQMIVMTERSFWKMELAKDVMTTEDPQMMVGNVSHTRVMIGESLS